MIKYICINETKLYNIGKEIDLKVGEEIEHFMGHMVFYKGELNYTGHIYNNNLETNFISLAEWREKQINSILDEND